MSPAAPAVAIPTRSEIEAWTTSHLADAATAWRGTAAASEDAFDQHRRNINSPGGTTWEGDAKDAALDRVTRDISVVGTQNEALRAAAENDDFTVADDLSVTDNRAYDEETAAARATAAAEHAEDIRWTAERLAQADNLAGTRLQTKAAELEGIRFDGETDGRDPTIRMVDNETETKADGEQPAKSWQDMLLSPEAGGEPATDGAPKPDDDAAKNPLNEMLLPDKATDPNQPETLNEALDEIAGQPVHDKPTLTEQLLNPPPGTGKPGDRRYTKSPLESPILDADPSAIERHRQEVLSQIPSVQDMKADPAVVDAARAMLTAQGVPAEGMDAALDQFLEDGHRLGEHLATTPSSVPPTGTASVWEPSFWDYYGERMSETKDGFEQTVGNLTGLGGPDAPGVDESWKGLVTGFLDNPMVDPLGYEERHPNEPPLPRNKEEWAHAAADLTVAAGTAALGPEALTARGALTHEVLDTPAIPREVIDTPTAAHNPAPLPAMDHPAPDAPSPPHPDTIDSPAPAHHDSPDIAPIADLNELYWTDPDTTFFWSGRTEDGVGVGPQGGDLGIAAQIADEHGGVTLESFQARNGIELPDWGDGSDPAVVRAWEHHSAAYAANASGEVRAVLGENLRPGNIWETVELPRLIENPNVPRIFRVDPGTGVETLIYQR